MQRFQRSKRAKRNVPEIKKLTFEVLEERAMLATWIAAAGGNYAAAENWDPAAVPTAATDSDKRPAVKVIPRGLRSFQAADADFFLELLPGPRDRDGLPDGIRFWKRRIEEADPDQTFAVGLLYGPSGCGKSSLVKAGLLPRLADRVRVVYLEASADETETRLLHGLRKRCPALPNDVGLKETLAALRRSGGRPRALHPGRCARASHWTPLAGAPRPGAVGWSGKHSSRSSNRPISVCRKSSNRP